MEDLPSVLPRQSAEASLDVRRSTTRRATGVAESDRHPKPSPHPPHVPAWVRSPARWSLPATPQLSRMIEAFPGSAAIIICLRRLRPAKI
jgi:hypothetical protein